MSQAVQTNQVLREQTKIKALCVFCGSSARGRDIHRVTAAAIGKMFVERDIGLIYGGSRLGLMGVVADTVMNNGGKVTGIIPDHLQKSEIGHDDISELIVVDSMHERKRLMFERSDAFVVLPGGFGTLDETFEILTWKQLHLHEKPIVIVNVEGYWDPLRNLIEHTISEGYAHPSHNKLFNFVNSIDEIIPALEKIQEARLPVTAKWI